MILALWSFYSKYQTNNQAKPTAVAVNADASHIVSDSGAEILQVVTSVNSARRSALRNANLITSIVNAFPPEIEVLVFTNDRSVFSTQEKSQQSRVSFIELPADNPITIWPQDPFVVLESTEGNKLLMSKKFDRAGDDAMAPRLSEYLGWPVIHSELEFEGGNIVADELTVFVGENTLVLNANILNVDLSTILQKLQQEFGKEVVVIGPAPQPIPHIDMMLTPLGNNTVVLADSTLGANLIQDVSLSRADDVLEFEMQSEKNFFGHPDIEFLRLANNEIVYPPVLQGATATAIKNSLELGKYLDAIAEDLVKKGYQVHRVPLLMQWQDPAELQKDIDDDNYRPRLTYPMLTYNNVLLEKRKGKNRVYLPQYGLDSLDSAATVAWQKLGFEVHPVGNFTTSSLYGGALRCSVKVLQRKACDCPLTSGK